MSEERPSKVTEKYWISADSPKTVSDSLFKSGIAWFIENAEEYAQSGKIYPRDIYSDDMITPQSEPDITLHKIDLETIKAVSSDPNSHHLLIGKWLIYVRRDAVDSVWKDLSSNIGDGRLLYHAKVSTARVNPLATDQERHVICVYTPNYLFREDVRKCRLLLRGLGFKVKLYYKPDVFTYKTMYRVTGSPINHRYFG